jgi:hypothetical protein
MATKVESGSTCIMVVYAPGDDAGTTWGLVDNVTVNDRHISEFLTGIGAMEPQEPVYHGKGPVSISWGRAVTTLQESAQAMGLVPKRRNMVAHEPCDVEFQSLKSGRTLLRISDVLPGSFSTQIGEQRSIRQNGDFQARISEHMADLAA